MDGEIDYSGFSRSELLDTKRHTDKTKFPINYRNLVDELNRRPLPPSQPTSEHAAGTDGPWHILDDENKYRSLPNRVLVPASLLFLFSYLAVAFLLEFGLAYYDYDFGVLPRIIYFSIASVPTAIYLIKKYQRLPTHNEFTSLIAGCFGMYVLANLVFYLANLALGGSGEIVCKACGALGIPILALLLLIDAGFIYFAFRYPFLWSGLAFLRRQN